MAQRQTRRLDLPIGPELAGIKVDTLLKKHLGLSGTVVRRIKWLEDGILVDGRRVNTRFVPLPEPGFIRPPVRPGAAQRNRPRSRPPGHRV